MSLGMEAGKRQNNVFVLKGLASKCKAHVCKKLAGSRGAANRICMLHVLTVSGYKVEHELMFLETGRYGVSVRAKRDCSRNSRRIRRVKTILLR
jgi:hypothetical protein